jgi:hypothetical protein
MNVLAAEKVSHVVMHWLNSEQPALQRLQEWSY